MSLPPAPAPSFPRFVDDLLEVDDESEDPTTLKPPKRIQVTETSSSKSSLGKSKSRVKSILLWENPKVTGLTFAVLMMFFYLTMFRQQSIVAVVGGISTMYFIVGLSVVQMNSFLGGHFEFVKRPSKPEPIFVRETVLYWADTLMDEGNVIADYLRGIMYCDDTSNTIFYIFVSLAVFVIGKYFSVLPIFFCGVVLSFSLPLLYEKNRNQVDDVIAMAGGVASRNIEVGRQMGMERALQFKDLAAAKLQNASPGVRNLSSKLGLTTPVKKSS